MHTHYSVGVQVYVCEKDAILCYRFHVWGSTPLFGEKWIELSQVRLAIELVHWLVVHGPFDRVGRMVDHGR